MSIKAYLKPQHSDVETRKRESYEMGTDTGLKCENEKYVSTVFS